MIKMNPMLDKRDAGDFEDLSKSTDKEKYLPIDPSHTSDIGEKIETPIVKRDEGISGQSAEWEDQQERNVHSTGGVSPEAERYLKDPSPEEMNHEDNNDATGKE
jgi:hypothetical protein